MSNKDILENEKFQELIKVIEEKRNSDFNIFKVLRLENYEIRHSNFLAWLFNKSSHGLDFKILKECFIKCFSDKNIMFNDNIKILTEYCTDKSRRIDILIIGDSYTITIENKYGSCEHGEQCQHYREFINNKFKDKENFFIFLDIEKPQDFDSDEKRYDGYKFLSYKDILDILKKQNIEKSGEHLIIQHYINILEEKYKPLNDNIKVLCKEINNIDKIIKLDDSTLSEAQKSAKSILIQYQNFIKKENDEKIKPILENMVKNDEKKFVRNHNNGYANVIDVNYGFMNQIDYTTCNGLKIAFYAGLKVPNSRELVKYIETDSNFINKINDITKKTGWSAELALCANNGAGYKESIFLRCNLENNDVSKNIREFIIKYKNFIGRNKPSKMKKLITELMEKSNNQIFDEIDINQQSSKLDNANEVNIVWKLNLVYNLQINNADNKLEIAKIYREKTLEGLKIFGKDKDFETKILH